MISVIAAIISAITTGIMAYISYKYPFKNEKRQVTKAAKFFGFLVTLSVLAGGFIIFDSYHTKNKNELDQQGLKDSILTISLSLKRLNFSIDSLGYKRDNKTGELVLKDSKKIENSAVVRSANSLIQQTTVKGGKPLIQQNKIGNNQANENNGINKGLVGNGNNNHIISGNGNKVNVNGDINIGNMPKIPDEKILKIVEDSIPNKNSFIYLIESTTNSANRAYCEKLKILLNDNNYTNVQVDDYSNTRVGNCPEPGIHIYSTGIDKYNICVSEE